MDSRLQCISTQLKETDKEISELEVSSGSDLSDNIKVGYPYLNAQGGGQYF